MNSKELLKNVEPLYEMIMATSILSNNTCKNWKEDSSKLIEFICDSYDLSHLKEDYKKLICMYGEKDQEFKKEFFPSYTKSFLSRNIERLNGIIYRFLAYFYFRFFKKQKRN